MVRVKVMGKIRSRIMVRFKVGVRVRDSIMVGLELELGLALW